MVVRYTYHMPNRNVRADCKRHTLITMQHATILDITATQGQTPTSEREEENRCTRSVHQEHSCSRQRYPIAQWVEK